MGHSKKDIDKLAIRLKELDREIGDIGELANKAVLELKAEYHKQIQDLFLKKAEVQDIVSKLQRAGGDAWEEMKSGSELSWEAFDESVKSRNKNIK